VLVRGLKICFLKSGVEGGCGFETGGGAGVGAATNVQGMERSDGSRKQTYWGWLASTKDKLVVPPEVKQSISAEVRPQTWVVLLICEKCGPSGDGSGRLILS
jgi:hypothetical protein